jgi:cell division protein FtsI (penicillin-binding protein 3)
VLLVLAVFIVKLVDIQVLRAEGLAAEGLAARIRTDTVTARRGDIISADGTTLATDVKRYRVGANQKGIAKYINPKDVDCKGPACVAGLLAPLLDLDEAELEIALTGHSEWVVIAESVPADVWAKIADLEITGLFASAFYERIYPAGAVAGNIIGFPYKGEGDTDVATHFTGLEGTQDEMLRGTDGSSRVETGTRGQEIPGGVNEVTPAQDGCTVRLTIDSNLQWEAQQAIDEQVEEVGAINGMVVVVKVSTGEILALADSGTTDPLSTRDGGGKTGSRSVEEVFEPGSTGKVISMAMVLETGEATPTTPYTVPAQATFGGQSFKDHDDHATAQWTLNGILAQSSNVGTIMAAQNIPDQTRYDYLKKFGFGTKTGVELPGESPGILHQPGTAQWDGRTRNTVLFGQGVAVNALQAAGVYATLGNDGIAMPLHLVKAVECGDEPARATAVGEGTRVVSAATAATLRQMLESVVDDGTGGTAKLNGYRVAGKTGTSEAFGESGTVENYISSFIGLAPAEDPEIAVAVMVRRPLEGVSWGATNAAPVFKRVAAFAMRLLDVPPSSQEPQELPTTW